MMFYYDPWNVPQNLPLGCIPVPIRFLQEFGKIGIQGDFQFFLGFRNLIFFCFQSSHTVSLVVMNGCFAEETGISLSFLESLHLGFLVPEYFLLMFSLAKFLDQVSFLLPNVRHETRLHSFDLHLFYFVIQLHFFLKDVTKRFFVPFLDF